jgi:hypothetical protein
VPGNTGPQERRRERIYLSLLYTKVHNKCVNLA